jgi:hypothetical protein
MSQDNKQVALWSIAGFSLGSFATYFALKYSNAYFTKAAKSGAAVDVSKQIQDLIDSSLREDIGPGDVTVQGIWL